VLSQCKPYGLPLATPPNHTRRQRRLRESTVIPTAARNNPQRQEACSSPLKECPQAGKAGACWGSSGQHHSHDCNFRSRIFPSLLFYAVLFAAFFFLDFAFDATSSPSLNTHTYLPTYRFVYTLHPSWFSPPTVRLSRQSLRYVNPISQRSPTNEVAFHCPSHFILP
jgi:hypothetical protein